MRNKFLLSIAFFALAQQAAAQQITGNSGGGAPSGAAGGSLGGTYPNPTVVTNANLTGDVTSSGNATTLTNIPVLSGANLTTLNGTNISSGTVANARINTGTSGATVPLLNGANTWGANQTMGAGFVFVGGANSSGMQIDLRSNTFPVIAANPLIIAAGTDTTAQYFSVAPQAMYLASNGASTISRLSVPASGTWQFGAADTNPAVAQTIRAQSATGSNIAGQNWTHIGSLSTGSGVSGDIVFQTGATGAGATTQNTATNALVIKGATQNIRLPAITSDAALTDSTVCQDTTNHALFSGSGTLGICLGTSSARFKHDIAPLRVGLAEILRLRPISYKLNADHGDPNKVLYGFTAEAMQPVLPKLVGLDKKGRPNTADYLGLVPVLVRAIQEQEAEIEALKLLLRVVK